MAVISIRLNEEDEKKVNFLSSIYNEDKSTLIKHSINEMYEDFQDKKTVDDFEEKGNKKKHSFISAEDILKDIM
jgi:predicted DNA-binding protein